MQGVMPFLFIQNKKEKKKKLQLLRDYAKTQRKIQ
jgi:hypothetical protein